MENKGRVSTAEKEKGEEEEGSMEQIKLNRREGPGKAKDRDAINHDEKEERKEERKEE